jgi:hypothetical protein
MWLDHPDPGRPWSVPLQVLKKPMKAPLLFFCLLSRSLLSFRFAKSKRRGAERAKDFAEKELEHLLLRLDSLIGRAMRPRSADYFRKIGLTANERAWTRIRKIVDRKKGRDLCPQRSARMS